MAMLILPQPSWNGFKTNQKKVEVTDGSATISVTAVQSSKHSRVCAAIDEDVLPGYITGLSAA